jgi:MFS family permease
MRQKSIGIVLACFFTIFIAYSIRYGYGMLLPPMLDDLGISKTDAGAIYASYFLAYTLFSPLLGWLSDKYSLRLILTSFMVLLSIGAALMACAASVFSASIYFILCGVGHAACWAPVMALVQRSVPYERRGMALAFTTMGSGIGIASWGIIIPVLVSMYSWKAGWLGMGLCGLCIAGLNALFVTDPPEKARESGGDKLHVTKKNVSKASYAMLLKDKQIWMVGLAYSLVGFSVLVPYTFLSTYSMEQLDFTFTVSTRFFVVIAISGLIGKIVLGSMSDVIGRIKVMILCGLLLAVGCFGIAMSQSVLIVSVFAGVFGFGFGAVWPVYAAAAPDFFPLKISGSVIGIWTVFLGFGSIVSPVICGWTIDHTGGYTLTFLMGTGAGVGSALLLIPMLKHNVLGS